MNFKFGTEEIGGNNKAFIVAEVAQAHDGSVGYAHSFIDAAFEAGVDAVKFQAHYASYESTMNEPFRINFSFQDASRYDYWKRMEFTKSQWIALKKYTESKGLIFLCTPFSEFAVDLLDSIGVIGWKIGSAEASQKWLIDKIIQTGKPIIFSTGMSQIDDIDLIYSNLKEHNVKFAILHCMSMYPTPLDKIGIHNIREYSERYEVPIGLSDHSGVIWPSIYAIVNNAKIIEVHIKLNNLAFGPDTTSSLSVLQIKEIVEARDAFYIMENSRINEYKLSADLSNNQKIFSRSIALDANYKKGTKIEKGMILMKKPGTGISEKDITNIIGKTLSKDYDCHYLLERSYINNI